jgi:hypothetical protein
MAKLIRMLTIEERMLYLDLLERAHERLGAQPGGKLELSDQTQKTMSSG